MMEAERPDCPDPAPMPATVWGPWFCAFASGMVGTTVALVTLVPICAPGPRFDWQIPVDPRDVLWRAISCLAVGFVIGAGVGLAACLGRDRPPPGP